MRPMIMRPKISYLKRYVLSIHDLFQMSSGPAQHTLITLTVEKFKNL